MVTTKYKNGLILFFLLITAACRQPQPAIGLCNGDCIRDKLLPAHITKISDIKPIAGGRHNLLKTLIAGGDDYSLSATAIDPYTNIDVFNILGCAADIFAKNNGYAGWKIDKSSSTSHIRKDTLTKSLRGDMVAIMYQSPLPDDVNPLGKKDWCSLIPPEAK